jgi:hypothetical protein
MSASWRPPCTLILVKFKALFQPRQGSHFGAESQRCGGRLMKSFAALAVRSLAALK